MPTIRQARVGEMIKRELAEILQREMRDPRLALVTVTGVDVARDFTIAKVFISAIGTPQEKAAALRALQGASGFLRGRLGRAIELRSVPALAFRYDTGIERGVRMYELLRQEEKELAELLGDDLESPSSDSDDAADTAEEGEEGESEMLAEVSGRSAPTAEGA
jgi:ribosome-binding factor A